MMISKNFHHLKNQIAFDFEKLLYLFNKLRNIYDVILIMWYLWIPALHDSLHVKTPPVYLLPFQIKQILPVEKGYFSK